MEERITRANVPAVEMTIREFLIAQLMASYVSRTNSDYGQDYTRIKMVKIAEDIIAEYDRVFESEE